MAKKKRKKKFSSKGEKKVNGCGSLQDQKSHQVRKHEKTERQDFRKKSQIVFTNKVKFKIQETQIRISNLEKKLNKRKMN